MKTDKYSGLFRISILVLILSAVNSAATVYVDSAATGANSGGSWENAYTLLQSALDVADSLDQIWVAKGTYYPSWGYDFCDDSGDSTRFYHFRLINGVAIYGGFSGSETAIDQRTNYSVGEDNETILSGDCEKTPSDSTDNCYHVFYNMYNDTTAILNGFTITGGNADGDSYENYGAGITNDYSSPKFINCIITGNTAVTGGGGVYNYEDAPIFTSCTITDNSAQYGGGIYNELSSPSFTNCNITTNSATDYNGGGIYNCNSSAPVLTSCTISSNSAYGYGGGIHNYNSSAATLTNCTISENSAYCGGGMYNDASAPVLNTCTFNKNSCDYNGGAVCNTNSSSANLTGCTISENTAYYGGGVYNSTSNPILTNCTINSNSAIDGGGLDNQQSSPSLTNCKIKTNSANNFGGGMYNYYSTPTMTNCLIITNSASYGGGTYENYSTSSTFINSTIGANSAGNTGGGVYSKFSTPVLKNCIVWGNQADDTGNEFYINGETTTLNYSCYANATGNVYVNSGTFSPDANCITADPRFVDTTAADYRLCGNSPAINVGYNTYNTATTDLRSQSRIQDTNIDMGAYEWIDGTDPDFAIIYVNAAKTNDNSSGGSWTNAKKTLQAALNQVISGDQIWVAKGTYYPTSAYDLTNSSRYYHFQMLNNVVIYGGFAGTETTTDQRASYGSGETNETILSGDPAGTPSDSTDNCYHVIYNPDQTPDIDTTAILDGFTITAANADGGAPHDQGAGVYNNYSSPSFVNCTITANSAEYNEYGGGVYNYYSSPRFTNCKITSNSGSGILNEYSSPTFTGCTVSGNTGDYGGGVYQYHASPAYTNCTISANIGECGGGVYNDNSAPTFTNCVIVNNSADSSGGGLYNENASPILINCTIALNTTDGNGGGLYNDSSCPRLKNSIIWGNEATKRGNEFYILGEDSTTYLYTSCYASDTTNVLVYSGRFIPDGYCLTSNPKFVDPSNDDFRICGNSPVVNTCDNEYNGLSTDLRGQNRTQDTYADMGAYEWTSGTDPDAAIIYVDADKTNDNGYGSSWTSAKQTLQAALDLAVSDDQVWVAAGTYYPTSAYDLTDSSRYYHFQLINNVTIYGGFGGSEVAETFDLTNRDFVNNPTVLSGDIGTSGNNSDNCYHIFYHPSGTGLTSAAVLDGFTITGGNANSTGNPHCYGGGMYNYSCSPTLNNITFTNNSANTSGGGLYNTTSSSPALTNCLISENSKGGIANVSSSPVLTNCTITANTATYGGGVNNISSSPTFNNCIVWDNTASSNGNEFYITAGTTTLNYCCYGNASGDVYNFGGTFSTTNNNITSDPGFVGSTVSADHPYAIGSSSPCADAGLDSYNSLTRDIRGKDYPRKLNMSTGETGTIDIGAYEYNADDDHSLAVELDDFSVKSQNGSVLLTWRTESETENLGFIIQRQLRVSGSGLLVTEWSQIASYVTADALAGHGSTSEAHEYTYTDAAVVSGETYSYRLGDVDYSGKCTWHSAVEVTVPENGSSIPTEFGLQKAYPNPFNPAVTLSYSLTRNARTSLKIYNMLGQEVATLVDTYQNSGSYSYTWQPQNLSSGVYLVQLESGKKTNLQKIIFMK